MALQSIMAKHSLHLAGFPIYPHKPNLPKEAMGFARLAKL
jgi:hypothetical protein